MNIVQEFSRFANQYESYNIVQSQVADKLISMVAKQHYSSVIDIGCGKGTFTHLFKKENNYVLGIDISEKALKIAQQNAKNLSLNPIFKKSDLLEII